jgi:hypothetical protein
MEFAGCELHKINVVSETFPKDSIKCHGLYNFTTLLHSGGKAEVHIEQ